jgi:hypothetical protein
MLTCSRLNVTEEMQVKSVFIENDLYVSKNATRASLMVQSGLVRIPTNLTVDETAIFNSDLVVYGSIKAEKISISKEVKASRFSLENEEVCIADGTVTSKLVESKAIKAETIASSELMLSVNINASNSITSPTINTQSFFSGVINTSAIYADEVFAKKTNISSLDVNGYCNIHGSVHVTEKLEVDEMEVRNGIKSRSIFSSRVYTQDISASGFITADTVINKGEMKVQGKADIYELEVESRLISSYIKVKNSLECTAATVHGTIDTGTVTTRKLNVTGDLIFNGINTSNAFNEMENLSERLSMLENIVRSLEHKLDSMIASMK